MSDTTIDEQQAFLVKLRRDLVETQKLGEERDKLSAERIKLDAEALKLNREAQTLDRFLAPVISIGSIVLGLRCFGGDHPPLEQIAPDWKSVRPVKMLANKELERC